MVAVSGCFCFLASGSSCMDWSANHATTPPCCSPQGNRYRLFSANEWGTICFSCMPPSCSLALNQCYKSRSCLPSISLLVWVDQILVPTRMIGIGVDNPLAMRHYNGRGEELVRCYEKLSPGKFPDCSGLSEHCSLRAGLSEPTLARKAIPCWKLRSDLAPIQYWVPKPALERNTTLLQHTFCEHTINFWFPFCVMSCGVLKDISLF